MWNGNEYKLYALSHLYSRIKKKFVKKQQCYF